MLELVSRSLSIKITEVPIFHKLICLLFEPFLLWATVNFSTMRKTFYFVLNLTPDIT